jgi:hypothetical protein
MMPRPVAICSSRSLVCPKCNKRLHKVHAGTGSLYATCDNTARLVNTSAGIRRERCGQHIFAIGSPDGVAVVVPISREEFDSLTSGTLKPAHVILTELDAITEAAS